MLLCCGVVFVVVFVDVVCLVFVFVLVFLFLFWFSLFWVCSSSTNPSALYFAGYSTFLIHMFFFKRILYLEMEVVLFNILLIFELGFH